MWDPPWSYVWASVGTTSILLRQGSVSVLMVFGISPVIVRLLLLLLHIIIVIIIIIMVLLLAWWVMLLVLLYRRIVIIIIVIIVVIIVPPLRLRPPMSLSLRVRVWVRGVALRGAIFIAIVTSTMERWSSSPCLVATHTVCIRLISLGIIDIVITPFRFRWDRIRTRMMTIRIWMI